MPTTETSTDEPLSAWETKIGRRLSAYEQRIRPKRGDVWQRVFGGVYRFCLKFDDMLALEGASRGDDSRGLQQPKSMFSIAAGIPRDGELSTERTTTHEEVLTSIRYGLAGGGIAIVDGKQITVTRDMATALVERHLANAPIAEAWPIARTMFDTAIHSRHATPEEFAAFSVPDGPPLVPDWAWETAA